MEFGRQLLGRWSKPRGEQNEDYRGSVYLANGEKYIIEYKQLLTVQDLCIEIAKRLGIAPVALDFFTLMVTDCEHCLRPNHHLRQQCTKENDHYLSPKRLLHAEEWDNKVFFFRLAFKAIPGPEIKLIDKGAFEYFVMQCRWDYLNGRISSLTEKDHHTLLILECILKGHENDVSCKDVLDNPKKFGVLHMFQDGELSGKKLKSYLKKQISKFQMCLENVDRAKAFFLGVLEGVADFGITKIVTSQISYNSDTIEAYPVEWVISANGVDKRQIKGDFSSAARESPRSSDVNIIRDYKDIEYLAIRRSGAGDVIHISRLTGCLEVICVGESLVKKESLITLIEGFYRLLVNQYRTLTTYEPDPELPMLTLSKEEFEIHGAIERKKAEDLLKAVDCFNGHRSGVHMIRRSRQKFDSYILSFIYGNEFRHYEIVLSPTGQYGIVNGLQFDSLAELLKFYKTAQGDFPTTLKQYCPIPKEGFCALFDKSIALEPPPLPSTSRPTNSANYSFELIRKTELRKFDHNFLRGDFGERAFKGGWWKSDNFLYEIFCRRVDHGRSPRFRAKLIRSAENMTRLFHRNLVQFIGVCFYNDESAYLAFEWVSSPTLDDYLIKEADISVETIITFAAQIAEACLFLHQNSYVHGWLAAHNVLVVSDDQVKVSDASVPCLRQEELLQSSREVNRSPWKSWECLLGSPYSEKSDVWSFGVVLWEMFTKSKPFQNMTGEMISRHWQEKRYLACPWWCPEKVVKIMKSCWDLEPSGRPNFPRIVVGLRSIFRDLSDEERLRKISGTIEDLPQNDQARIDPSEIEVDAMLNPPGPLPTCNSSRSSSVCSIPSMELSEHQKLSPYQDIQESASSLWQEYEEIPAVNENIYLESDRWLWIPRSVKHREKFEKLLEYGKTYPEKIQTVNDVRFCCNKEFLIGTGCDGTRVYIGLGKDGVEKAVKRLPKDVCGSLGSQEKEILNILDSMHVVRYWYYDENSNDEYAYLILDLCEETLTQYVSDQSLDNLRIEAPVIIRQILEGLTNLHGRPKPVLHRDLKPYNILRNVNGRWLLADFGISRTLREGQTTHQSEEKGTKYWRAVESYPVKDESGLPGPVRYKTKSDIQVTGMVSFYILTKGQHPFGPEEQRVINLLEGKPVDLTILGDPVAEDMISWMLKFKPEERPSAEEALKHLYFQSTAEQFELLSLMGNQPEVKQNDTSNNIITKLNNDPLLLLKDWKAQINPTVRDYLCTDEINRKKHGSGIKKYGSEWSECLRLIRNTAQHWNDRPRPRPEAYTLVGEPHVYFLKVFPRLPVVVHRIVRSDCEWKERPELKKFFA